MTPQVQSQNVNPAIYCRFSPFCPTPLIQSAPALSLLEWCDLASSFWFMKASKFKLILAQQWAPHSDVNKISARSVLHGARTATTVCLLTITQQSHHRFISEAVSYSIRQSRSHFVPVTLIFWLEFQKVVASPLRWLLADCGAEMLSDRARGHSSGRIFTRGNHFFPHKI